MKIWLKMMICIAVGMLLGLIVPQNVGWFTGTTRLLGELSINLLLYMSAIYIILKVFIGFFQLKKESKRKRFIPIFIGCILGSMIVSVSLAMMMMNIDSFRPGQEFRIFQIQSAPVEVHSFESIFTTILNANILSIMVEPVKYLSPLIFIGAIFGIASLFADKRMEIFVEISMSFERFIDKIVRAAIEIFPVFATFMITYLFNTRFYNADFAEIIAKEHITFMSIGKAIFVIILISAIMIAASLLIMRLICGKSIRLDMLGILGSGLIAFTTANTVTTVIPLTEQLQHNNGVAPGIAKVLTPIGVLFNKTGTIIAAAVVLMTILSSYHINKVAPSVQTIIALLVLLFSFRLDGSNGLGFIVLVAMVLQFKYLKLEENSYLLFMIFMPLLNRIAIFTDTVTTAVFVIIAAKAAKLKKETKHIDFI